jgi:hypothetical protein
MKPQSGDVVMLQQKVDFGDFTDAFEITFGCSATDLGNEQSWFAVLFHILICASLNCFGKSRFTNRPIYFVSNHNRV